MFLNDGDIENEYSLYYNDIYFRLLIIKIIRCKIFCVMLLNL